MQKKFHIKFKYLILKFVFFYYVYFSFNTFNPVQLQ